MYWLKVGAQTETELKEKKLRVEDALNATKVILYFWGLRSVLFAYSWTITNQDFNSSGRCRGRYCCWWWLHSASSCFQGWCH